MKSQFAILPYPGVLDSAYAVLADVLYTAEYIDSQQSGRERKGRGYLTLACTEKPITSARGTLILPDGQIKTESQSAVGLRNAEDFPEVAIIPGIDLSYGEVTQDSLDALLQTEHSQQTIDWLRRGHAQGMFIAAGCTGTFVLAETGLLAGRRATTSWTLMSLFRERYQSVDLQDEKILIVEDQMACAGAAMAHINLALFLVSRFRSPKLSEQVARQLLLDSNGQQASHIDFSRMTHLPPMVQQAEQWIQKHIKEPIAIEDVAKAIATSPRTLARRLKESVGRSPVQFIQHLRVRTAIDLLKNTQLSLESIASEVGYANTASLRRIMIRNTGKRPSQFRQR